MRNVIHKIGKFYSSIIMGNMGLFIFVGFLFVIFQEQGWFPDANIYAIAQLVYRMVIPICISYAGGAKISGQTGGVLSVLMAAGMVYADMTVGILAGMIAAPAGGFLWVYIEKIIRRYAGSSVQMLTKNLMVGIVGGILAMGGYYVLCPVLIWTAEEIGGAVGTLLNHHLTGLFSIFVEPVKILFLNNVLNHGILAPLGIQQIQSQNSSVLFLLETNPGPGFGMLAALYLVKRKEKETYAGAMIAEFVGGIHEVYFPVVLSDIRLLLPLMVSSAAGAFWFEFTGAGLRTPVSPGSCISILLLAGRQDFVKVGAGILISAVVSFGVSWLVLHWKKTVKEEQKLCEMIDKKEEIKQPPVRAIGFVCDAGVGSSAMGAALLRRKLIQHQITDIQVESYASDQISEHLDLVVCQKNFRKLLPESLDGSEILELDSLLDQSAFDRIVEIIKVRNG